MKSNIEEIKRRIIPILKEAGVTRSSLFGSVAQGEAREESDIDILVELPKNKSLFDLADLEIKLEKRLNKKVDLLTYNSIHPLLKRYILKDRLPII